MTKTLEKPMNHVRLGCHDCQKFHDVAIPLEDGIWLLRELESWDYKHQGHNKPYPVFQKREIPRDFDDAEFETAPWWLTMSPNTNFQTAFNASSALTFTSINSLASDANLLAGASSAVVDNGATGAPLAQWISAQIKGGTTPTIAKSIFMYVWEKLSDTVYPDTITGSDAAITIGTTSALNNNALVLANYWPSSTTTGATYPAGWYTKAGFELASAFGHIPRYWGVFIVHDTVAAFAASGHVVSQKSLYIQG